MGIAFGWSPFTIKHNTAGKNIWGLQKHLCQLYKGDCIPVLCTELPMLIITKTGEHKNIFMYINLCTMLVMYNES